MRTLHDTQMLESVVRSMSDKIAEPARQVREASARLSREAEAEAHVKIEHAAALSKRRVLIAEGLRSLLIMLAAAILVLAIGFAVSLIMQSQSKTSLVDTSDVSVSEVSPWPGSGADETSLDGGVITTDFTIFRETSVMLGGTEFSVTAGHSFKHEEDESFDTAWCYSNIYADGLNLQISLGNLDPGGKPQQAFVSNATLSKAGISKDEAERLFRNCPWLNGNPNTAQTPKRGKKYSFSGEVTAESVDALINAIGQGANVIELSSPGGLVDEAIRGHTAIRNADVKTVATGPCVSSCTLLFLGGSERDVVGNGSIEVHQWRSDVGVSNEADSQLTSAILVGLFSAAGVSEEFFVAGASTPADQLYRLSRAELVSWGVVTQ
ncbi:hypothetical protein [Ruegeria arenilitoris]|uniref:hypothetical protein n=1 Tax=Ruegeria arenilitoris TaxID=1173585 RepID=UPI00147A6D6E|nr:hypothetical protein [Ruegeria arenilitoris]